MEIIGGFGVNSLAQSVVCILFEYFSQSKYSIDQINQKLVGIVYRVIFCPNERKLFYSLKKVFVTIGNSCRASEWLGNPKRVSDSNKDLFFREYRLFPLTFDIFDLYYTWVARNNRIVCMPRTAPEG